MPYGFTRRRRIDAVLQGNDGGAFREQRPQCRRDPLDGPHLRSHDHDVASADDARIELGPDFNAESTARCNHGQAVLPDRRQVPLGDQQADIDSGPPQHRSNQPPTPPAPTTQTFIASVPEMSKGGRCNFSAATSSSPEHRGRSSNQARRRDGGGDSRDWRPVQSYCRGGMAD